jgi:RluA family pseudouridine synthase
MASVKHTLKVGADQQGVRLDHFLADALPSALGRPVSRAQARRLIVSGLVSRNGRREQSATYPLREGMRIDIFLDPDKFDTGGASGMRQPILRDFEWTPERILFEDEWLIVVDKPAGLPTQPTLDSDRASVFSTLQRLLSARAGGEAYLGLHHRLDRDTSGVLLLTKDRRANAATTAMFTEKTARKTYIALASGAAGGADWTVANHLGVVGRAGKSSKFGAVRSGGDAAETHFHRIDTLAGAMLVEARPVTGRTHQIRVHLSEGGNPILGDSLYGGPDRVQTAAGFRNVERVLLHAAVLEFPHPVTGLQTIVRSPTPPDFTQWVGLLRRR